MGDDPIVAEVRRTREAYARRFNYDGFAMWCDLKERQNKSGLQGASLSPKRIAPTPLETPEQRTERT